MKKIFTHFIPCLALAIAANSASGQVVIRAGTTISFGQTPDIIIQTSGDINTNNATDFADAKLQLNLIGNNQTISGNLVATTLRVSAGGDPVIKTINNTLTVTEAMDLSAGILAPGSSGKILFTGDGTGVTGGSASSYVEGPFYQAGGGYRFFPIGANGTYAPAIFENAGVADGTEMSVEMIAGDPALSFDESIKDVDNTRYWEIQTTDLSSINSRVSLGISGLSQSTEGSFAVVQSPAINGVAENLGFSFLDDALVTSRGEVTNSILAIGVIPEIVVVVHDVITPFLLDDANDKLTIDQLDQFDFKTVTMLDRWGVVVKRWENFTNAVEYDFSTLSPGNYIVVVEYGNLTEGSPMEKISQMVTVLKTN